MIQITLILLLTQQYKFYFPDYVACETQPPKYNFSVISTELEVVGPLVIENSDKLNVLTGLERPFGPEVIRATFRP